MPYHGESCMRDYRCIPGIEAKIFLQNFEKLALFSILVIKRLYFVTIYCMRLSRLPLIRSVMCPLRHLQSFINHLSSLSLQLLSNPLHFATLILIRILTAAVSVCPVPGTASPPERRLAVLLLQAM